jgi:hypothetical protein
VEDADIEQRFHLMQKQIEATVSLTRECKLDLMAAIDSLRIELEVLKRYMERYHPGFAESYSKFREEAIQATIQSGLARKPGKHFKAANPVGGRCQRARIIVEPLGVQTIVKIKQKDKHAIRRQVSHE